MAAEVAAYPDALLDHIEGVGVNVVQRHLHRRQFVLVQADAHHMHLLVGVAAAALPQGKAAVQLLQDGLVQPLGILLGEDDHLDGDILLMQAIQEQGLEHHIDGGVNGGAQVEQHSAQHIQRRVEGDGEPPHGKALALLAEVQTQHVQAAGGAAAGQNQAAGKAAEDAGHQAGGQLIGDDGCGRRRDHRQRDGVDDRHHRHADDEAPSQGAPGQPDQRQVHQQVQDTGQVDGRIHPQALHRQGTDHLAQAVQAAAVKPLGHHEQIDAGRQQNTAQHAHSQPQPFVLLYLLQHTPGPRFLCLYGVLSYYCIRISSVCQPPGRLTGRQARRL